MTKANNERKARRRRQRYKRAGATAGIVAIGAAAWLIVSGTSPSRATGYRTASAEYQTVQQTLAVTGSVEPDHDATATFQTSGTVSHVYATVGEHVTASQKLATLDTAALTGKETSAELALQGAEAALTENEDNEASGTSTAAASASSAVTASTDGSTEGATTDGLNAALTSYTPTSKTATSAGSATPRNLPSATSLSSAQTAVVTAQKTVDSVTAIAKADLAQAQTVCTSAAVSSSSSGSRAITSTASTITNAEATNTDGSTCTNDLRAAFAAQERVSTDETTLSSEETTLAKLLSKQGSSASSSNSSTSTKTGSTSTGSTTSGSIPTTAYDSAEQLASDQATIDTDEAALVEAKQSLAAATLVAPLSGTVAAVDMTSGDSVTAGDSSDGITIVDTSSYQVTASLTDTQVQSVKVGDLVDVRVDGASGALSGSVTKIGPAEDDDDAYVYPVTIALVSPSKPLAIGSSAQASIIVGSASHVIAVPTSAVHTYGTSYVEVVQNGKMARRTVTVGLIGTDWAQIKSGLSAGAQVVLANMAEKLPSSSTEENTTRTFGGAGFPSGGGFAAGSGTEGPSGGGGPSGAG